MCREGRASGEGAPTVAGQEDERIKVAAIVQAGDLGKGWGWGKGWAESDQGGHFSAGWKSRALSK